MGNDKDTQREKEMKDERSTLFLCPHYAAKSVIAAAYFERLAAGRVVTLHATSAGTDPGPGVSPGVAAALLTEGIDVRGHRPRSVTREELATTCRVVPLGCDFGDIAPSGLVAEHWDDVPSPSADLTGALAVIAARLRRLAATQASARGAQMYSAPSSTPDATE
jgi:protein-tyrosine-phosphatase